MIPSFRLQVVPRIPLKLGNAYVALATAHAALGSVAELAALYLLLAAGTQLLPKRLRITRYKALDAQRPRALVAGSPDGSCHVRTVVRSHAMKNFNLWR